MSDPRHVPEDAYAAFMSMPTSEWRGLLASLARGGVLTPAEQVGFERARANRPAMLGGSPQGQHEHACIIAKEHDKKQPCLCICGAIRSMEPEGEWDEP